MLWFSKDKRSRMARRYKDRQGLSTVLQRDLHRYDRIPSLISITEQAFNQAQDDEQTFLKLMGEPMPEHLQLAVHLETDLWVALRTTLESAQHVLNPTEYDHLVPQLQHRLTLLDRVLALEAEIMYSPLSKHFREQLQFLREVRS